MPDPLVDSLTKWLQSAPDDVKKILAEKTADVTPAKQPKDEANYRKSDNADETCGSCKHYNGSGGCEVVSGAINPTYVSDNYEPQAEDSESADTSGSDVRGGVPSDAGDSVGNDH